MEEGTFPKHDEVHEVGRVELGVELEELLSHIDPLRGREGRESFNVT